MKYSKTNPPLQCIQSNSTCYKNTSKMNIKGILWHSTGANNTKLSRYVQPSSSDKNYQKMINLLGKNKIGNDWNHIQIQAGVNAWIGKTSKGEITSVQTLPWDYKPWGCGSGPLGSCNNGWIQFEICEDDLANQDYFNKVYKEACELTAYLCKLYNLNPHGYVKYKGKSVPIILCHKDSYDLGLGSGHSDVMHWFSRYGKTMNDVRNDVAAIINQEDDIVTQEQFNQMMNVYLQELAKQQPTWEAGSCEWAKQMGLLSGDQTGNVMAKKFMTRGEMAALLQRFYNKVK